MAAPMLRCLGSNKILRISRFSDFYRTFLSESYKCDKLWKKRLESQYLQKIDPKAFGIELLENFEKTKTLHVSDIELFVNKIQDLEPSFCYIANEILYRFRHCQSSVPIRDSVMHSVVRGFLDNGEVDRLVEIIKNKSQYGVFPDMYSMSMLIDHFLIKNNYSMAASMAYEVMLEEEYENQTRNLLSLYAAVKHFNHTMDLTRPEPEPADEDEEVKYVPVKVIRNPYYDDHFEIKDERFLLGKTLYLLSKNAPKLKGPLSRSLQLIGLGLYEKFELANQLLEEWVSNEKIKNVISRQALDHYSEFLETAPTRNPDAEPKTLGLKTMDDEIELLKLTPAEKADCLSKLETLKNSLKDEKINGEDIESVMEGWMTSKYFHSCQKYDIYRLSLKYNWWVKARDKEVKNFIIQQKKEQVSENILEKFDALREREELLTYFGNVNEIKWTMQNYTEAKKEVLVEEEYVEAPGERNIKKTIKKGK